MRQGVEDNVDAHRKRVLFGDLAEVVGIEGFLLPAVTEVVVEAEEHDHAAMIIQHGTEDGRGGIWAGFIAGGVAGSLVEMRPIDVAVGLRWLGQIKDAVENGMLVFQFDGFAVWPDSFQGGREDLPFIAAPKVVHQDEAAVQHVLTQQSRLLVIDVHVGGFGKVEEWIVPKLPGI